MYVVIKRLPANPVLNSLPTRINTIVPTPRSPKSIGGAKFLFWREVVTSGDRRTTDRPGRLKWRVSQSVVSVFASTRLWTLRARSSYTSRYVSFGFVDRKTRVFLLSVVALFRLMAEHRSHLRSNRQTTHHTNILFHHPPERERKNIHTI
jgi:hypothetical protein